MYFLKLKAIRFLVLRRQKEKREALRAEIISAVKAGVSTPVSCTFFADVEPHLLLLSVEARG